MRALVFGGASITDYGFCKQFIQGKELSICCDGGMHHARMLGISPDYILGDFDSVLPEDLLYFRSSGIAVQEYPSKKDETDMELGLECAIDAGADEIVIMGGIGNRMDHTLANIHLLYRLLKQGIKACLVNENNYICLTLDHLELQGQKGDLVSLIPLTMVVKGITLTGMEYPLENAVIELGSPRGVSNVMCGSTASVHIREGCMIVIMARD